MGLTSVVVRCPFFPCIWEICFIFRNILLFSPFRHFFLHTYYQRAWGNPLLWRRKSGLLTSAPFCSGQSRSIRQEDQGRKKKRPPVSICLTPQSNESIPILPTVSSGGSDKQRDEVKHKGGKVQLWPSVLRAGLVPGQPITAPAPEKARETAGHYCLPPFYLWPFLLLLSRLEGHPDMRCSSWDKEKRRNN